MPRGVNHVQLLVDFASVAGKIGIDKVDDELGRVHVERNREATRFEVWLNLCNRTAVGSGTL